jgi:hypothetical protein
MVDPLGEDVMRRYRLASVALLAATPLSAQTTTPVDESVVVEGQRIAAEALVRETIDGAGVIPLGRFEDKVCPGVVGLGPDQAARMLQILRANFAAFGADLQKLGCTANATVIFTPQPAEFVRKLAIKEPGYFDSSPAGIKLFTAKPRPVLSWHVIEVRDRDGNELGNSRELGMAKARILDMPAAAGAPMNARVLRNTAASKLATSSRADMLFGFAVIDAAKIQGKSMEQLADLATLHLLLEIKQDDANNPASILSLFDERPQGASPPPGLSAYDRAMIEALYRPKENNRTAAQQFSQITTAVRRAGNKGRE